MFYNIARLKPGLLTTLSCFFLEEMLKSETYFVKVDRSTQKLMECPFSKPVGPFVPLVAILDFMGVAGGEPPLHF